MKTLLATAAAVVLAVGLAPLPAHATALSGPLPAPGAAAAGTDEDPLPEATPDEKYKAAVLVGAGDDFALQALQDCDFTHRIAVHDNAGPEMREDAQAAFNSGTVTGGSASDCTAFIREGIFAAHRRDQDNESYERTEREARQAAAAAIGLPITPALLAMDNYSFTAQVLSFAEPGTRVYAGADAAVAANDAGQLRAFITTGIFEAHRQDVIDAIEADEKKTEAEKAAALWKAAKARALAVIGVVATEEQLVLDDTNFVYLISTRAADGSEVEAAATEALSSFDPAKRKAFIETGIYAANQLDITKALRKQADENRAAARQIQAAAENSLVHPAQVAAAATALAGTDADVSRFLRDGQYAALTQTLRTTVAGKVGWYLRGSPANTSIAAQGPAAGSALTDATWKVTPGLGDIACHSLESATSPGYYLREVGNTVKLAANDGSAAFKTSATWCASVGRTGSNVTLESKSKPGRFLRHFGTELWTAVNGIANDYERACNFNANVTWKFDNPAAPALADKGTGEWCGDAASFTYSGEYFAQWRDTGALGYGVLSGGQVVEPFAKPQKITPAANLGEFAGGDLDGVKVPICIPNPTCVIGPADYSDDLVAVERGTNKLWLYPNLRGTGAATRREIGTGWNGARELVIGKFCLSATATNGNLVMVERSTGILWCYTMNNSTFAMSRKEIGHGWSSLDRLTAGDFAAGDANASDIIAIERATGVVWLYPSKVGGGFHARVKIFDNWSGYVSIVAGNFNGSGSDDLIATDTTGKKWFYSGNGAGKFAARVQVG